jgi:hypothetical protein
VFFLDSSVIATMRYSEILMMTLVLRQFTREIADKDRPIMADAFYEELFRVPLVKPVLEPDTTKSAQGSGCILRSLHSPSGFLLSISENKI